jgi:phosphinothricin acetyltransferase
MIIRAMLADDWPSVCSIYAEGIATENATFETETPDWQAWDAGHLKDCRLVGLDDSGKVAGWAALTPVSSRCVYAGVAEVSVYVAQAARGQGLGRQLLQRLVKDSEAHGIWTLQSGILAENEASIRLHLTCGFRLVGKRERLGKLNRQWRDVVLMERRSKKVGVE